MKSPHERTYEDVVEKLKKYHVCNLVRPTGFGKTRIFLRLGSGDIYDKVVFVYPRDIIGDYFKGDYKKLEGDFEKSGIVLYSYQKLTRMYGMGLLKLLKDRLPERTLFIFDESHFVGAQEFLKCYRQLRELFPEGYFLGGTATSFRTGEMFSVTDVAFEGVSCFRYTLNDCIRDGIFEKVIYRSAKIDMNEKLQEYVLSLNKDITDEELQYLNEDILRLVKLNNVPDVIKGTIEYAYDKECPDYMKYIVFFPNRNVLYEKAEDVVSWFQEAFPDYIIDRTDVVSWIEDKKKNLYKIQHLEEVSGKIDLIFCIDMLSYGYHVDNLTSVVLMRPTDSDIVYWQQVGRVFSAYSKRKPIIIDLVGSAYRFSDPGYRMKTWALGRKWNKPEEELTDKEREEEDMFSISELSCDIIDYSVDFREFFIRYDKKLQERVKGGLLKAVVFKGLPPKLACKELGCTSEELVMLMKREKLYEDFVKVAIERYPDWLIGSKK